MQYVDDGMVGGAGPEECLHSRDLMIEHMEGVGFVVSAKKLEEEGTPTTCLVYIGVQIDTVAREFRLDPQRLEQTRVIALTDVGVVWTADATARAPPGQAHAVHGPPSHCPRHDRRSCSKRGRLEVRA